MLVYFMAIWNILRSFWYILWPFGNVVVIWYVFPRFGNLCQEKSGNPACAVVRKQRPSFLIQYKACETVNQKVRNY
jgi:hypothetical protein